MNNPVTDPAPFDYAAKFVRANHSDTAVVLVAALAVTLLIFIGFGIAHYLRTKAKEKRHSLRPKSDGERIVTADGKIKVRQWKRKRRRDHRPRNPTLSETGGLPPKRDDESESPTA
jgi:hypothetical protein